jgi:diaminopimelate epimerase
MSKKIPFYKLEGAGNDFILIDNRSNYFLGDEIHFFQKLCNRHFGIGADGIMLITYNTPEKFYLRFYNSNGQPAEMCGNGARCAIRLMNLINPQVSNFDFEIYDKSYSGEICQSGTIKIYWQIFPRISEIDGLTQIVPPDFSKFLFVNSGVPHLILVSNRPLVKVDIAHWGPFFRFHQIFSPEGTNVNFIEIKSNQIHIRTYERGVEDETLACGTGAIAASIAAHRWQFIKDPVEVQTNGGLLRVGNFTLQNKIWLEGQSNLLFTGEFDREDY